MLSRQILHSKKKAFTLLETILAITLASIILASAGVSYREFNQKNQFADAVSQTRSAIRTANIYARSGKSDDDWSVHLATGEAIIYKGQDFGTRDQDYDLLYRLPGSISFSGATDIVFAKKAGTSSYNGAIQISDQNETKEINISTEGYVH